MAEWIARKLLRLALRMGAVCPSRIMITLLIDGRPMVILHDEQAEHLARFDGGALCCQFVTRGEIELRIVPLAVSHSRG